MENKKELKEILVSLKGLCDKIEAMLDEGYTYEAPDVKKYVDEAPAELTDHQLKARVSEILKEVGVPASLLGYKYLRYAICIAYRDDIYLTEVTKKALPCYS